VRRLFWTFPDGLPGAGLLVMRLATSSSLLYRAVTEWQGLFANLQTALWMIEGASALLLLVGLATPYCGVSIAAIQAYRAYTDHDALLAHALLATLGVALALLGPGATSIDARIFGWRRIDVAEAGRDPDRRPP
jgi:putative oxidoreductase